MTLDELKQFKLIYVATPYSKYPGSIYHAFLDTARIMARLRETGLINIYSPILHCHPMSIYGGLDPLDYAIWVPMNAVMMDVSETMLVVMMDGWETSKGICDEVHEFLVQGKPIFYLDPKTLGVMRASGISFQMKAKQ